MEPAKLYVLVSLCFKKVLQVKKIIIMIYTHQQYNKKSVKFDQGLDFLKVWRGKSKKTIGKRRGNEENTVKFKDFRV